MNNIPCAEYFATRRSCRAFTEREVDDALISEIVTLAGKAPTTGNMQLYSVVATRIPEAKADLAKLHFNQSAAVHAPLLLTVCADINRFERWCALSGTHAEFDNLQGMLYATFDAVIFAQQLGTISELAGLGTCILGTTAFNAPEIAELLKLPCGVVPLLTLAVGYPAEPGEDTERIQQEGILHFERYTHFTDSDIAEIYAPKDTFEANRRYVAENDKPSLAHVFTEVRYPGEMNRQFSDKLLNWLERQRCAR